MGYLKNELSEKSKYYLSKHRYLELKHFCLQYPEWKDRLLEINDICSNWAVKCEKNKFQRRTEEVAIERELLLKKIDIVEKTVKSIDAGLYKWLLIGITQERSYVWLSTVMDIPCGKDMYYDRYRKFYWLLSQNLQCI